MKLAFSTLGCPGWTWDEIFATAKDLGFDGIEVRGVGDAIYAPDIPVFKDTVIEKTVARLRAAGLSIPMLTTGIALAEDHEEKIFREAEGYLALAVKLGCRYLRVMSTSKPAPSGDVDMGMLSERYRRLCDMAAEKGVSPLIETNGPFASTAALKSFLDTVAKENAGVLWDLHHPFRFSGSDTNLTIQARPWAVSALTITFALGFCPSL